jgi:tryptophan synthase alpha chain
VFLAAPTSTDERLRLVAKYSSGFVYLVSRTGITGFQQKIADSAGPLIERMRAITDLPLVLGFGISKPEHVAQLADKVEALAIGTAIVKQIEHDPANLESFVRSLSRPAQAVSPVH